ncbi:MAG: class I SAM-dependent methyltransferase [Chitinophagaceae bacterium]
MSQKTLSVHPDFHPGILHPLYLIRSGLYAAFRHLVPQLKGKLMDFGCGLKPYEAMFTVDEYVGVDYKGDGPTYSHHKVDVFYDGHTLPFQDDHFDSIFSSEVFEHVFNLPEIMGELRRVLKPGGLILVSCPFAFGEHEAPADYARYTSFAMKSLFTSHGFEVVHYEKTGSFIEAIVQQRIAYWDRHVISRIAGIPVLRTIARVIIFGGNNVWASLWKAVLPKSQELYLNNVMLAKKLPS